MWASLSDGCICHSPLETTWCLLNGPERDVARDRSAGLCIDRKVVGGSVKSCDHSVFWQQRGKQSESELEVKKVQWNRAEIPELAGVICIFGSGEGYQSSAVRH